MAICPLSVLAPAAGQNTLRKMNDPKEMRQTPVDPTADRIRWFVEMEARSGSMDHPSATYIARMLQLPLEEVEAYLKSQRQGR